MESCRIGSVRYWGLAILFSVALAACGGGGSGGGDAPEGSPASAEGGGSSAGRLGSALIIAEVNAEEGSGSVGNGSPNGAAGGSLPNRPPTIDGRAAMIVTVGSQYRFLPSGGDPDGDSLTYSISGRPPWTFFNQVTGQLQGRPGPGDVAVYNNIRIRVSDGIATAQLAVFKIEVQGTASQGFMLSWDPPALNSDGSALVDLAGYRIYLGRQAGVYSDVFELNNPGLTAYVFDQLAPGTYYVAVTAVDADGNESGRSRELSAGV